VTTISEIEETQEQISTAPGDEAGSRAAEQRALERAEAGDLEGEMAAWEEAVQLDPSNERATFRVACLLDRRGEDEQALDLYERLVAGPNAKSNALLNLAVLYEDRGEYEKAAYCCKRVLASSPNHRRARLFLRDAQSSLTMYYDEDQERVRERHHAILDTAVSDFELSVRARNCLKQMNIHTLGDLLKITEQEMLGYKNFGETSLNEIKAMLRLKGLHLGQASDQPTQAPQEAMRKIAANASVEVLSKPVSELELSVRSRKCLQRLNINSLGELAMRTEAELLGTKNFGQTSLTEVKQRLSENGLSLRKLED